MVPRFLRLETVPFASFEFVCATAGLPVAIPTIAYRLHVRDRRGVETTQTFSTALLRSCALIALSRQPVDLRIEDVTVDVDADLTDDERRQADDDARDEQCGSQCGGACGWCGRCS